MNKLKNNKEEILVDLVDKLTPFNNNFRQEDDPIKKIEVMWEFGKILDVYLKKTGIKLHSLLYMLYDPHSTIKFSNITRDIGSYSYRILHYFKNKEEIKTKLFGLKKYSIFRESIPLLFNSKYKLNENAKNKIFNLITSEEDPKLIIKKLKIKKQEIITIKNPRNQKAIMYKTEREYLGEVLKKLLNFYKSNISLPSELTIRNIFGDKESRVNFVNKLKI